MKKISVNGSRQPELCSDVFIILLYYTLNLPSLPPAPTAGNLGRGKGDLPGTSSVCRIYLFPLISTDLPASISTPAILQRGGGGPFSLFSGQPIKFKWAKNISPEIESEKTKKADPRFGSS